MFKDLICSVISRDPLVCVGLPSCKISSELVHKLGWNCVTTELKNTQTECQVVELNHRPPLCSVMKTHRGKSHRDNCIQKKLTL